MPVSINGDSDLTGLSAGGLPDASITTAEIADAILSIPVPPQPEPASVDLVEGTPT